MNLKKLLNNIIYEIIQGNDELIIDSIAWDSRNTGLNSVFICTKGKNVDRHQYAKVAVNNGAVALIVAQSVPDIPKDVTIIKVKDTRIAMANIANTFYGEPSKQFNLIGVTGTNGKTSVTYIISKIFENLGRKTGIIGTIENKKGTETLSTEKLNPTTPDAIELQASFSEMVKSQVSDVIIEATSSALENHRVDCSDFDIAIFTNLTQDHLDEHGTMENYKNAKLKLFNMCRLGLANGDDPIVEEIKASANCEIFTYGIQNDVDFKAENIQYRIDGVDFTLNFHGNRKRVIVNIPGRFSVYNALASIAACYFSGISLSLAIDGLNEMKGVRGRFEVVPNHKGLSIIVDYAHTPDALLNILTAIRELSNNKLTLVFGCGGDRDKTKRSLMGKIAGTHSDYCIITSDNPRSENPHKIIEEIETGIRATNCLYEKIENRANAIQKALYISAPGDIIAIVGKGHENYQIIGDKKIYFDDVEEVEKLLLAYKSTANNLNI